ncbi:MAG: TolC family protein [Burkholderiales bacterium]|nr:TolC family protein [Burkholderiales bacterium]
MLGIITGCARQAYVPRAMELNAAVQEYSTRVLDAPALEQYLHAQGVAMEQWPLPRWDLGELTLAAFFHRSELHAARARGAAARAQVVLAAQRAPLIASPRVEHHSGEGASSSPWSLGFDIEIPLTSAARRSAAIERAEYLAQAAELELGARAWQVRSEVRAQLLELHAARLHGDSLEREVAAQQTVVDMLQRRLQEGYAGVSEVDAARLRLAQAKGDLLEATTQVERALGGLAQAVGVPPEALRAATLSFAAFETLPPAPDAAYVRRQGLTNRLDLRRSLLEFDAADATVKLEIARQYPDFSITPGYLWDQGDNMWSFALDLLLPATITHGPAIRAAMAQREAAAREALALQDRLLGEVEARCAVFAQARVAADAAQAATRMQLARSNQIQRQFDVGQADRVELTLAHIEALLVQRRAMAALIDAQRILGQLEDALQVPLSGGPLPAVPDAPVHAAGGA